MKLKILLVLVLVAVGIGTAWMVAVGGSTTGASAVQYLTSTVSTGDVTDSAAATGTVATTATYGLVFGAPAHLSTSSAPSASTTWPVSTVPATVGESVKKGQILATAATVDLQAQLVTDQRSLDSANLNLVTAKKTLKQASGAAAKRQARIGLYGVENQVAQAQQTVDDDNTKIASAMLIAPIDGVVTAVNVTPGSNAPSGDAIVMDAASLEVTADIVETDLPSMKVGQAATVAITAVSATVPGTVTTIAPVASSSGGSSSVVTFAVTVSLQGPPATVRPGMSTNVTIIIAQATGVLRVPATALQGTAGNYTVRLLDSTGQLQTTPVTVGLVTASEAEVDSGLTAGETVITGIVTAQTTTTTTTTTGNGLGGGGVTFGGTGGFGGFPGGGRNP